MLAEKENEKYLLQLEQEQSLPDGCVLVKPDPFFCIKSKRASDGAAVFINICTFESVK
jgi:hypothetical protein